MCLLNSALDKCACDGGMRFWHKPSCRPKALHKSLGLLQGLHLLAGGIADEFFGLRLRPLPLEAFALDVPIFGQKRVVMFDDTAGMFEDKLVRLKLGICNLMAISMHASKQGKYVVHDVALHCTQTRRYLHALHHACCIVHSDL